MELLEMIVISLQITTLLAKKKFRGSERRATSSDESIENLLYYKDCKHKPKEGAPEALAGLRPEPPKQPACPCPRMCCSMCCDCNAPGFPQSFVGRQMSPLQMPTSDLMMGSPQLQVAPQPQQPLRRPLPVQPQIVQRGAKKKMRMNFFKPDSAMPPPGASRRGFSFTRENIKSLISKDQDIKKILKDLVKVTMSKVDLVERVKSARSSRSKATTQQTETPYELDDELELREEM